MALDGHSSSSSLPFVISGAGSIRGVSNVVSEFGLKAPLFITSASYTLHPALKKILRRVDKASLIFGVTSAIDEPYTAQNTLLISELFSKGGFDSLVVFGGSNLCNFASRFVYDYAQLSQDKTNTHHDSVGSSNFIPYILIPTELHNTLQYNNSNSNGITMHEIPKVMTPSVNGLKPIPLSVIIDERIISAS